MNQLYKHQNTWYVILRRIPHDSLPTLELVKEGKEAIWRCDHVLKDQTHYLFCETVEEAKIV
jgi:hypothetical protein